MKKIIMNIVSMFIIVLSAIFLVLLVLLFIHASDIVIEAAILTLSISIILSVFLARAIYHLIKNERS